MRLNRTDVFATLAVGIGVVAYVLWLADVDAPVVDSARVVGAVVLGLGWLASAVAVVPSFDELLHSSRVYLAVTSLLGVTALVAGILVLVDGSEPMLAVLVSTTVAMWVLATLRHIRAAARSTNTTPTAVTPADDDRTLVGTR